MDETIVRSTILRVMYETYFRDDSPVSLDTLREQLNIDTALLEGVVNNLESDSLIRVRTAGPSYNITAKGILAAEESGSAPSELAQQNERIRTVVLDELVYIYAKNRWSSDSNVEVLARTTGFDVYAVVFNLKFLDNLGYVKPVTFGSYAPTERGEEVVSDWRQRKELLTELERIKTLRPQQRGREFQKLFARIVDLSDWSYEEGVRTSHEEIDLIVHKNHDYYLIECKWEKESIESPVVRELYGKLGNRTDIQGVLVSMSGFTSGAAKQVQDYANTNLILLFGQEDVNALISSKSSFDDLIREKRHQLVTRRIVLYR